MRSCFLLLPLALLAALLVGCTNVAGDIRSATDSLKETASGALTEAKVAAGQAMSVVGDVKKRVETVQEGIIRVQEGKALIQKGVKGE